jgi:hypothetical protein
LPFVPKANFSVSYNSQSLQRLFPETSEAEKERKVYGVRAERKIMGRSGREIYFWGEERASC